MLRNRLNARNARHKMWWDLCQPPRRMVLLAGRNVPWTVTLPVTRGLLLIVVPSCVA